MPGQPPPAPPRDRARRILASAASALAVLGCLASPGSAGPAIAGLGTAGTAPGDSVPLPAARPRPARWVADAPAPGGLIWIDRHHSAEAGAGDLLVAHGALSRLGNRLLPTRLFEEERFAGRTLSVLYRLAKFNYLDWPAAHYLGVVQHEVFGHGWRGREAGFADIRFEVQAPPPYGPGGGMTRYDFPEGYEPGLDGTLARTIAGIEAEDILARRQRDRFLREGSLDYPGAVLYLSASLGLADYVTATDSVDRGTPNDVSNWLLLVNWKAGRDATADPWVSLSDLKRRSAIALADPFLWYSAWATGRYLWSGSMRWRQPMIPLGPVRWLPSLGYRLSPFGGQYLAENLLTSGPRAATLRAAWGDGELGASWGADLEAQELARWRGWSLDAALRAWSQPPLRPEDPDPRPPGAPRLGAGMSVAAVSPALSKGFPLRLAAGVSAKRAGYVPGESLEADLALRAGVGLYR